MRTAKCRSLAKGRPPCLRQTMQSTLKYEVYLVGTYFQFQPWAENVGNFATVPLSTCSSSFFTMSHNNYELISGSPAILWLEPRDTSTNSSTSIHVGHQKQWPPSVSTQDEFRCRVHISSELLPLTAPLSSFHWRSCQLTSGETGAAGVCSENQTHRNITALWCITRDLIGRTSQTAAGGYNYWRPYAQNKHQRTQKSTLSRAAQFISTEATSSELCITVVIDVFSFFFQ